MRIFRKLICVGLVLIAAPAAAETTQEVPRWSGSIETSVEPHGVAMFRVEP